MESFEDRVFDVFDETVVEDGHFTQKKGLWKSQASIGRQARYEEGFEG